VYLKMMRQKTSMHRLCIYIFTWLDHTRTWKFNHVISTTCKM
jgi:hypothetical protein